VTRRMLQSSDFRHRGACAGRACLLALVMLMGGTAAFAQTPAASPPPDPPPEWSEKLLESLEVVDGLAQRFAAVEGRAVNELIEEALKNAAAIAAAGNAPAPQPASAPAKKAAKAKGRRR